MAYFEEKKYQLEFDLEKNKKDVSLTNDDVMGHPVPEELPYRLMNLVHDDDPTINVDEARYHHHHPGNAV